jgi:hypothetical protein
MSELEISQELQKSFNFGQIVCERNFRVRDAVQLVFTFLGLVKKVYVLNLESQCGNLVIRACCGSEV